MTDAYQNLLGVFSKALSNSVGIVGNIFIGLIVVSVVVVGFKLVFGMESGIQGLGGLVFTFIRFFIVHLFILNFVAVISIILSIFAGVGNLIGEAGNATLSAREIVNNPFILIKSFWESIGNLFQMDLPQVGLADRIVLRLLSFLVILGTIFFLTKAAIQIAVSIIEYYLIALFGLFYIPFYAFSEMKNYYEKSMSAILASALKVAASVGIASLVQPIMATTLSRFADATDFGGYIALTFEIFSTAILIYMLIENVPGLIRSVLSGMPSLNSQAASRAAGALGAGAAGMMGNAAKGGGQIGRIAALGSGALAGGKEAADQSGGGLGSRILHAGSGLARAAGRTAGKALGVDKMKNAFNFGKASANAKKDKN